jgi:hypothetical protein
MICFIPTKGRLNTKTYKLFEDVGINVFHFIEPQEIEQYQVPNKISILENNKGIGYVRNFMLNYAKEKNIHIFIMCDDDINSFGKVIDGKCVKTDASVFFEMLPIIEKMNFELYGMSFRQFAWSEKNKYSINSKVFTACTIIKPKKIKWKYPDNFKEDICFLFETIKNGNGIFKFNHYFFNCPPVGSNKGGCYEGYQNHNHINAIKIIIKKYNGFVEIVKKKNTHDLKWNFKKWALLHKKYIK